MIERRRKRAVQSVTAAPQFYGAVYGTWLDTGDYEAAAVAMGGDLSTDEIRRAVVRTREAAGAPTLPDSVVDTLARAIANAREADVDPERYAMQIADGHL